MAFTQNKGIPTGPCQVRVECAGMNIDHALKIFKSKVKQSKHLELYKEKQEYLKPSIKKRLKSKKARKRLKSENKELE